MGTPQNPPDENAGLKRAQDFNDAMLNIPGYADDSMFFIVRYVGAAKEKLRECDFQAFMEAAGELDKLDEEKPGDAAGGASREERALVARQKCLERIKDYPELVRDFDAFCVKSRSLKQSMKGLK